MMSLSKQVRIQKQKHQFKCSFIISVFYHLIFELQPWAHLNQISAQSLKLFHSEQTLLSCKDISTVCGGGLKKIIQKRTLSH